MKYQEMDFSPPALDFSQEVLLFRQELRERFLAAVGGAAALSDDVLNGLNAAGGYNNPLNRDTKHDG